MRAYWEFRMEKLIFTLGPVIFRHDGSLWKSESSLEPVTRSPLTAKGRQSSEHLGRGAKLMTRDQADTRYLRSKWKNAAAKLILIPQLLFNQKSRVHTTTGPRLSGVARQQVSGSLRLYHSITERQRLQCESMRRSCHSEKRSKTTIILFKNRSIHSACFCEGYNLCRANV